MCIEQKPEYIQGPVPSWVSGIHRRLRMYPPWTRGPLYTQLRWTGNSLSADLVEGYEKYSERFFFHQILFLKNCFLGPSPSHSVSRLTPSNLCQSLLLLYYYLIQFTKYSAIHCLPSEKARERNRQWATYLFKLISNFL